MLIDDDDDDDADDDADAAAADHDQVDERRVAHGPPMDPFMDPL